MNFIEYPDREVMFLDLANKIAGQLRTALDTEGRASFCVPGGTTPGPVFDTLSAVSLDWERIDVLLNDERWVPESSERSNTALLKQRLLTGKAANAHLVPLYRDVPTPEEGLADLMPAIEATLPLNVLLLGMGTDMHTASLFPGADQLELGLSDAAPTLLAMRAPGAPEPRITLSAKALKTAISTHILITGPEKREALERAQKLDEMQAPVSAFLSQATVHWAM
ncbi:6-phosphogluconolactonase [Celeribacter halophilus]|uniref:6-phosphogluconolactonase n=1 Tax=Celeribacter halophilus TaxID=576117 RepID=A0AAW7XNX9_9RHOB|nr:6-phosphogluconolactonase [Celeribacter halophilus]MDO6455815.1 6-phosphogluconolactonase [Celeribacter halophilus]MDO6722005.1 6-phosphogluconolactonase [Celeribacter halophilus]